MEINSNSMKYNFVLLNLFYFQGELRGLIVLLYSKLGCFPLQLPPELLFTQLNFDINYNEYI